MRKAELQLGAMSYNQEGLLFAPGEGSGTTIKEVVVSHMSVTQVGLSFSRSFCFWEVWVGVLRAAIKEVVMFHIFVTQVGALCVWCLCPCLRVVLRGIKDVWCRSYPR